MRQREALGGGCRMEDTRGTKGRQRRHCTAIEADLEVLRVFDMECVREREVG